MKEWIIAIFVIAVLLIVVIYFYSPNFAMTKQTSIADIVKNPDNYLNKTVTVIGNSNFMVDTLSDEQGYIIHLDSASCSEEGRILPIGKYKARGIVHFYYVCKCDYRYVLNVTEEDILREKNITKEELENLKSAISRFLDLSGVYWLFLPSPEEGWESSRMVPIIPEIRVSDCKTEVYKTNFTVYYEVRPFGRVPLLTTEILKEQRCLPNSVKTSPITLICTEPMTLLQRAV
jgi:hypothetical protein